MQAGDNGHFFEEKQPKVYAINQQHISTNSRYIYIYIYIYQFWSNWIKAQFSVKCWLTFARERMNILNTIFQLLSQHPTSPTDPADDICWIPN